jgi:L-ascorbate metabolism protein UlaG (beta-lactamase superfamily)
MLPAPTNDSQLHLTYVGHATLLLETDGIRLLTDPLLRSRVTHLRRRALPVSHDLYRDIDAVLISHLHWDHFDRASLRCIDRQTRFIVPSGSARLLRREGFRQIDEVDLGDHVHVGPVAIKATYADHGNLRLPFGRKADSLGYLIKGAHTTYFPGDTDIFSGMARLSDRLDLALMPVWGWGPSLGPGHMDAERAAEALTLLQPRVAVPIHWGTFHPIGMGRLSKKVLRRPPRLFASRAARRAPGVKVLVLQPGESADVASLLT